MHDERLNQIFRAACISEGSVNGMLSFSAAGELVEASGLLDQVPLADATHIIGEVRQSLSGSNEGLFLDWDSYKDMMTMIASRVIGYYRNTNINNVEALLNACFANIIDSYDRHPNETSYYVPRHLTPLARRIMSMAQSIASSWGGGVIANFRLVFAKAFCQHVNVPSACGLAITDWAVGILSLKTEHCGAVMIEDSHLAALWRCFFNVGRLCFPSSPPEIAQELLLQLLLNKLDIENDR